jgi:hypothetical protein
MKRKLLHYFEGYPIHVVTSFGLGKITENRLTTGRIAKWELKLMGLYITYIPQMAIKCQALADLLPNGPRLSNRPLGRSRELEHVF